MDINIVLGSANHDHYRSMLKSFAFGIKNHNVILSEEYTPCDVMIIFGSWKNRQAKHHIVKNNAIHKHKGPFIVIETPILGRKIETEYQDYRVGINHFLNNLGDFNNKNMPNDRWEKLKNKFNIDLKPYRKSGDHIVIALQIPGDASLLGKDISEWAIETVHELRKYTDRKIIIRPHKLIREYNLTLIHNCIAKYNHIEFYDPSLAISRNDFNNCWATVTYTSGYAVDSLLAGIPTFPMHKGNMAYNFYQPLSNIETPKLFERKQWLYDLAYAQWDIDEMQAGLPWNHLENKIICLLNL